MNSAWATIADQTQHSYADFEANCENLQACQRSLLIELLKNNADSLVGKEFGFTNIVQSDNPIALFQKQVPLHRYDDIDAQMQKQMAGGSPLVSDVVQFYEQTGGSTGGAKYIPYTEVSLQQLQAAVEPWLHDLIQHRPNITQGPAYWSVSPALSESKKTADGTLIGAPSDLAFMRDELQLPFAQTLIDLSLIQVATDYQQWQKYTLLTLVLHDNLRLISIWSPTFLTTLLEALETHAGWLQAALTDPVAHGLGEGALLQDQARNQQAIERLNTALSDQTDSQGRVARVLWPQLDTISCWTHGPANGAFQELRRWFPSVYVQAKGLLATEGVVSVPMHSASHPVLALNSGFFEFVDDEHTVHLSHELKTDQCYRVLMTNASGLYRYDIGDQVRVRGYYKTAPMIEFVGRSNNTSDLVGEKLQESFVSLCLADLEASSVLAPNGNQYCLYLDNCVELSTAESVLAEQIDQRLCENPQYRYARELGQLGAVSICRLPDLAKEQLDWQRKQGRVVGDIKPTALCANTALSDHLHRLHQEFARA